MDSSISLKDQIWFLRVCHHVSNVLYIRFLCAAQRSGQSIKNCHVHGQTVPTENLPWRSLCFEAFQTWSETVKFCIRVREVPGSNLDADWLFNWNGLFLRTHSGMLPPHFVYNTLWQLYMNIIEYFSSLVVHFVREMGTNFIWHSMRKDTPRRCAWME
jgi:hypothetical protein